MFAGRIRLIHVIVIAIVLVVALVTVGSQRFGLIHSGGSKQPTIAVPLGTPTDGDIQVLGAALALDLNGHYDEALATLHPLLSAPIPATAAQALLATAKVQLELRDTLSAIKTLTTLRSTYPQSPEANDAELILGQTVASQGDKSGAIRDISDFARRNPDVAPYANLLVAQYLADGGKWKDALAQANAVAAMEVIDRTKIDALELVRTIEQKHNNHSDYVKTTNQLLDLATTDAYRAQLIYERGDAERTLGNNSAATADLQQVIDKYPDSTYAVQAAADLNKIQNNPAVTSQREGLLYYDAGDYQDAIASFDDALAANALDDKSWYYRALSTLRAGDDQTATVQLSQMPIKFPQSSFNPQALYTAGRLNEGYGHLQTAQDDYQGVIQRAPDSDAATNSRLRLGFVLYQQADYHGSISILQQVSGSEQAKAQARFWEGKAFQRLGQPTDAQNAWMSSQQIDPYGYYGQRAAQLLTNQPNSLPLVPAQTVSSALSPSQKATLDSWYSAQGTTADASRIVVEQDAGYQRMNRLFALGLTQQAGWELSAFADRNSHNLPVLAEFGNLLLESDQYNAAYRVGLALQTDARAMSTSIPDALNRLAYPLAFPQLVTTYSASSKVDPLLFLALVRQESAYDPTVTSSADARGLAQIIPNTASVLAESLGVKNWTANQLFRPYVGVEFGTIYLSDRVAKFNGSIAQALAAYNAGDSNAAAWAGQSGANDPDVFTEEIPFTETYDYVQQVYANYLNYVRLYR
ncbi:MAG TPA: transglycosylase SLT domain-containing protein [Nitrolancea sp.]|nr:transglycosylase SLT domain-containing protein [Nitrolancea sp.]